MEFSLILFNKLAAMTLMALVGFALVRFKLLRQDDSRVISVLLVYVLQPCLIARAFQIDLTPERVHGFIYGTLFAAATILLSMILSRLFMKPLGLDAIDRSTIIYANVGNLLLPLVSMALGDEMVFYCSSFQIPFNLLLWTHCFSIIKGDKTVNLKKLMLNPNLIALYIGVFLLLTRFSIPPVIDVASKNFNDMVAASSMLLVGMIIAGINIKTVFTFKKAYLVAFGRLLVVPILSMFLLYATGFLTRHPELRPVFMVIVLGAGAPSASSIVQIAVLHDKNAAKAGIYNVMTTLLCVVTMPLIIFIYQMLFPG